MPNPEQQHQIAECLRTHKAQLETIAAIREGIASAKCGEGKPAEQVFAEMKAKYGIKDDLYADLC